MRLIVFHSLLIDSKLVNTLQPSKITYFFCLIMFLGPSGYLFGRCFITYYYTPISAQSHNL